MFSNPVTPSALVDEGTVIQVDPIRYFCKVRTLSGQVMHSVQWLLPHGGTSRAGDRFAPGIGDRVMLNFGLGYPVIVGFFPRLQSEDGATPMSISDGVEIVDTGSYSPEGGSIWADQNKAKDGLQGDRIISSVGGSMLALLRAGAVLIRSNRGSELFLSNFKSLVRVVSRNWEHFSDVSSDVIKNFKGRVYRYVGYAPTFLQAKAEDYRLHFYYGDAKAAETVKTAYNTYSGTPPTDTVVYKEQITDLVSSVPRELMRRTVDLTGNQEVWITNGTHFTRVTSTPESLTMKWNDQNTFTITEASIHAVHKDGADVIMDSNGIRATFGSGNINMSSSSIVSTYGSGTVTMDSTNITSQMGAGQAQVSASSTKIVNGSHAVTVTSGGVAIT